MSQTVPSILGQTKPTAGVDTTLFSVGVNYQAQFTVYVANQGSTPDTFTVALVPNGGIEQGASYIAYNTAILANGVVALSGLFLNSGDRVQVASSQGQCSFTATGLTITP